MTATATATVIEAAAPTPKRAARRAPEPIPFRRIVGVEFQKMFDTRAGLWLMASIGITAVIATIAVIVFAPDSALNYESFGTAVGVPLSIVLPIIAILSVTSEWSQRSGLTTFTLVPHRGRVIWAKLVCSIAVGVIAMPVALGIGAIGNIAGSRINGVETTWGLTLTDFTLLTFASVIGMLMGFMLGVLIRNSPGAIVGYFIYGFVLPGLLGTLAVFQEWFADLQGWVDFTYSSSLLYDHVPTAEQWAQIAVSGAFWLAIPLAIGVWLVHRTEVK